MAQRYSNKFKKLLEQEEPIAPDEITPEGDVEAFDDALGDTTSPDQFSTDPGLAGLRSKHMAKFQDIINRFEEFAKYLNSDSEDSVNLFLNAVDKDGSIFTGVSRETGKITTVAESLAALSEALRGYVLTGQRKQREQESAMAEY